MSQNEKFKGCARIVYVIINTFSGQDYNSSLNAENFYS